MAVSKSWAFTDQDGQDWISAAEVARQRAAYGGASLEKIFWSTHPAGQRKRMKHSRRGTPHFAYINGAEAAGGGGGESLQHRLFKEAVAGITGTTLKLGHRFGDRVTITHGEVEKRLPTVDGVYYADAYWRFVSEKGLALKWSGELYLEIRHTHGVPREKQDSIRRAGLPVVEIDLPPTLAYEHGEKVIDAALRDAYVRRIRKVLQGENGFLAGRLIHDPSSEAFLERMRQRARQRAHAVASNGGGGRTETVPARPYATGATPPVETARLPPPIASSDTRTPTDGHRLRDGDPTGPRAQGLAPAPARPAEPPARWWARLRLPAIGPGPAVALLAVLAAVLLAGAWSLLR